jgi:SAM-dependent methyltransferase
MPPVKHAPTPSGRSLGLGFASVAETYDRIRPGYPGPLFDDIHAYTRLDRVPEVLEAGCGTGKATVSMAARGWQVIGIEPGPEMAAVARRHLASLPNARVIDSTFEDAVFPTQSFDVVCAATAWHWVDPAVGLRKAHELLRPGGVIAIFGHTQVRGETSLDFFVESQEIYERVTDLWDPDPGRWRRDVRDMHAEAIAASGLFEDVTAIQYDWDQVFDADSYALQLRTYSGVIALTQARREQLIAELADLIRTGFGGRITRPLVVQLAMGRKSA